MQKNNNAIETLKVPLRQPVRYVAVRTGSSFTLGIVSGKTLLSKRWVNREFATRDDVKEHAKQLVPINLSTVLPILRSHGEVDCYEFGYDFGADAVIMRTPLRGRFCELRLSESVIATLLAMARP